MKRISITIIAVIIVWAGIVFPCAATLINLDLYNSEPLVDLSNVALQGNTAAGDLVQVILLGAGNVANAPDQFGNPTGNNTLLSFGSPTNSWLHVGYSLPFNPDQGLLDVFPLKYDSSLALTNVIVRFFNASSIGAATYYGDSSIFTLPVGTGPGLDQASLDFAPTSAYGHITDQPFNALLVVPEPSNLLLFGMVIIVYWMRRRRTKVASVHLGEPREVI